MSRVCRRASSWERIANDSASEYSKLSGKRLLFLIAIGTLLCAGPANASETISYTYDALGRLVQVSHDGWPVNRGMVSTYQYDKADNRSSVSVVRSWTAPAMRTGDFNGDGRGDLLWQRDDGLVNDWLGQPDGSFVATSLNLNTGPTWHVVGLGDFNGDGRADIMWQNDDGTLHEWLGQPDGTFVGNLSNFNVDPGIQWHVVGVGDFNGDGRSDLLLEANDATVTVWFAQPNGSFAPASWTLNPGSSWHVVGVGDVNGDGRADVVWQNDDGHITTWLGQPDGSFVGTKLTINLGTNWYVVAVGDFNCNGMADILWRSGNGDLAEWNGTSTGSFAQNTSVYYNVSTSLRIAAIGHFHAAADRCDDIIWRNVTGDVTEWLGSAGGNFTDNPAGNGTKTTDWHIEPR